MPDVLIKSLSNGLTVVIDEMAEVESVAYELLIPGGVIADDPDSLGGALILSELSTRGAGALDTRALSDAFERLGVRHSEFTAHDRFVYRGALLGENLEGALSLVSQMILAPRLPESELASVRSLFLQDLASLDDNPSRRAVEELSARYYPDPYGRSTLGTVEGLNRTTIQRVKESWSRFYHPAGAVLSICGKIKGDATLAMVERIFGEWRGSAPSRPVFGEPAKHQSFHIPVQAAQLQVVLAYPGAKFGDPDYYVAKVVSGILSGGMFGRLFIEVREKRALCYSVYARHSATKEFGTVLVYAGTTPERAQSTLDVTMEVLLRVRGSVTEEELNRVKANIKSSIVLGEESSAARASSNGIDYWIDQRVRPISEIRDAIEQVGIEQIDQYIEKYGPRSVMLLTLGSTELEVKKGIV